MQLAIANKAGSNIVQGATPAQITDMQIKWSTNLTQDEASTMITIATKPESTWTLAEKFQFGALMSKLMGLTVQAK